MITLGSSSVKKHVVVAIKSGMIFPYTENVLVFGRPKSVSAINSVLETTKQFVVLMQKKPYLNNPTFNDLYKIGVLVEVVKVVKGEKGELNILLKGLEKVRLIKEVKTEPHFEGEFEKVIDKIEEGESIDAMVKHISTQVKKAINLGKNVDFTFLMNILNVTSPHIFSYQVASVLDIKSVEKQGLLEETILSKRLEKEIDYINKEVKILEIERNIAMKTQQKFEKGMKESFLREKMKTIEEELGQKGENHEYGEYMKKIKNSQMPQNVEKKAIKELKRLSRMSQYNPEASYIRTYLDWLIDLPWNKFSKNDIDISDARTVLNKEHYGLDKVKTRILEFLAVMKLKKKRELKEKQVKGKKKDKLYSPTILCFVGPPGVGKTSLGKSIAKSLGREFVKISLGGIRDEAEIRGHRRTYVGALPGRIIQGIKQAKTKNPVFMLDEIDKIGKDYRGDPSAALLEALDPEQNHSFTDHYLEVPFDLSNVFFITTANILDTIPSALLDRLEIIHFPGYTEYEKFNIARKHIIPKQITAHALDDYDINITDGALHTIIRKYTREAGVRELERNISAVLRKIAKEVVEGKVKKAKTIGISEVSKYLGPYKYLEQMIEDKDTVGIVTGLAWTQAGGDILFIEVAVMPGKGSLTLTGHLGNVMKESCQAALSYIRARWDKFGLPRNFFNDIDIHVHVPEGAVPKDGPSAGISIVTAMVSALTRMPVKRDVAMTGEITLRGRVLEIGGVKEKIIAAHRAKIKTVIMPKGNKRDLEDIPKKVIKDLNFVFINHIDEALRHALVFKDKKKMFVKQTQKAFLSTIKDNLEKTGKN